MVAYKFPSEPFFSITLSEVDRMKDKYLFLYDITLENVRANKHNHYLSYSKLTEVVDDPTGEYKKCVDNGRLVKCKSCRITCTNYDLECILQCYDCQVIYNHIWASYAKYLDKRVIEFILDRYVAKTELKGVSEDSEQFKFYMKMKQELNSVYGMAVTNPLKTGIEFDCMNGWSSHAINDMVDDGSGNSIMFIDKKLHDMKKSYSTLFYYAVGVFVTAIARYNLWQAIMQLDNEVIYYDTDSIKGIGAAVVDVVQKYNSSVLERLQTAAAACEIDINRYMPSDRNGVKHPLGIFECETWDNKNNCPAYYTEFKTMGAKKYVYRDSKGVLHMTVSGVRKSAVSALDNNINNFTKGFKFGYKAADKLIHYYTDEQAPFEYRDVQGNIYRCSQKHAIILQPTTYTIGITDLYESLLALASGHIGFIG